MSAPTQPPDSSTRRPGRALYAAGVVALVLLGSSALAFETIVSRLGLELRKLPIEPESGLKLHSIPKEFKGWRMVHEEVMSAEGMAELGTENFVTRHYQRVNDAGLPVEPRTIVQLHAAYYTGMIDTVPHVPERCMIGGGLEYAGSTTTVKVPLDRSRLVPDPDDTPPEGQPRILTARNDRVMSRVRLPRGADALELRVTPFRDPEGKQRLYAGYFFMANGGVVASANDVRLLAFRLNDDYAYYMKVQFLSTEAESAEHLASLAASMLDDLFPDLMQCVPDWTEVEAGRWPPDNPANSTTTKNAANR